MQLTETHMLSIFVLIVAIGLMIYFDPFDILGGDKTSETSETGVANNNPVSPETEEGSGSST